MSDWSTPVVDAEADDGVIEAAAQVLRQGGLVAFPTETVYGLGALGLCAEAVAKIFEAKKRPPTNPVILHVASIEQARRLAEDWPREAEELASRFWPGPLTLVVRRSSEVPDIVTAGLDTVAIRMPAHEIAQNLIDAVGQPLAAPSANRYTEVSPTTAEHVRFGLDGRLDLIVDGGASSVGVESTLVAISEGQVEILRPGMISRGALEGVVCLRPSKERVVEEDRPRRSPGLSRRHYSPKVSVRVVDRGQFDLLLAGGGDGGMGFVGFAGPDRSEGARRIYLPRDVRGYARRFYDALHQLDREDVEEIVIERPPGEVRWLPILDRLGRMS